MVPGKDLVSVLSISSASGGNTLNVRVDDSTSQRYAGVLLVWNLFVVMMQLPELRRCDAQLQLSFM